LSPDALEALSKIERHTTLRYAMQLIITSHLIAAKRKSPIVELRDIGRAYSLFLDQGRSVAYMQRHQTEFISGNEWEAEEKTEMEGGAGTLPMQDVQA